MTVEIPLKIIRKSKLNPEGGQRSKRFFSWENFIYDKTKSQKNSEGQPSLGYFMRGLIDRV